MFFKQSKRIENISDTNAIIIEIYKKGGNTYQLFCDAQKSSGTMGDNINYCLKLLTDNGFVMIIDNKQMTIPNINMDNDMDDIVESINQGFEKFKEFVSVL